MNCSDADNCGESWQHVDPYWKSAESVSVWEVKHEFSGILWIVVVFLIVLGFAVVADRGVVRAVDYSLLGTFVALFIFIGNLGLCNVFVQIHYTLESPVRFLFYEKVLSGIHGVQ